MEGFFSLQEDIEQSKMNNIQYIYKRYYKMLYYIALRIIKDEYLAEDVLHNVFIELLKNDYLDKVGDIDSDEVKKYLAKSITNQSIDMKRKQIRNNELIKDNTNRVEENIAKYSVEMTVEEAINCRKLMDAINDLPKIYYDVLVEHSIKGKAYHVIARQTGVGIETIRKRIYRARKILKRKLHYSDEAKTL